MIAYLVVLSVSFFLIAYLLRIFKKPFYSLAESSLSVVDSLMSSIEEDEKVKLVQKHINKLLMALLLSVLVVFISFGVGLSLIYLFSVFQKISFYSLDLTSLRPIIVISIGSTIGFIIPVKSKKQSSYSDLSQLLHRMVLNNYNVAYKLFKIDAKRIKKLKLIENKKFVIISGLARSGTTSLMNNLSKNETFVSLSYANMPFITSPNLWKRVYNPKSGKKKERSHKDGIMIGLDSNEALEEYFFKVLANDSYISEESIKKYSVSEDDYSGYLKYQTIVKSDNEKVYLAKNNNFILRYNSIRKLNNEFLMVVMYREPLSHASSLLERHKDYSAMQEKDPFILEYMNWLGHHEFGKNQKPFQFEASSKNYINNKDSLDYWLQIWINYYSYILTIDKQNLLMVNYDSYCEEPQGVLNEILVKTGVRGSLKAGSFINKREVDENCSAELKESAKKLYKQLKDIS